jgi:hypothetical protein
MERRRQQGIVAAASANSASKNVLDNYDNMGALVFPGDMEDIGGPSIIRDLAASSSDELLDPPIT